MNTIRHWKSELRKFRVLPSPKKILLFQKFTWTNHLKKEKDAVRIVRSKKFTLHVPYVIRSFGTSPAFEIFVRNFRYNSRFFHWRMEMSKLLNQIYSLYVIWIVSLFLKKHHIRDPFRDLNFLLPFPFLNL